MNPSKLFALFDKVKLYRKYPSLVIKFPDSMVRFSMGNDSNVLWVTNGRTRFDPKNILYGRFSRTPYIENYFFASREISNDIKALLVSVCEDPLKYCSIHGQQYKHCCFCNTELTSKASLFAGYGPICADNWGLPWGEIKDESLENL